MWWLALLACAGAPEETDSSTCGDAESGTLRACIYMSEGDEQGIAGGKLYLRAPGDEVWTEARAGADGCASVDVLAGAWEVRGEDDTGYCLSPAETVTVAACETTEHRFDVLMWCVDG